MRLTLIFLALLISNSSIAQGCKKSKLSPPEAFKEADIVFRGNIENLQYLDSPERTKKNLNFCLTLSINFMVILSVRSHLITCKIKSLLIQY